MDNRLKECRKEGESTGRDDCGNGEEKIHLENTKEIESTGLESCCDVRIKGRREVFKTTGRFLV